MKEDGIKARVKRSKVRAVLKRAQDIDLDKFNNLKNMPLYDNVEENLNIAYMNRDEVPLGMDIFKPKVPEGTDLPVVVTIHGGGLSFGDRKLSRPFGRLLASRGYLVFSIEYRLIPQANLCQQLDDVCAGLDLIGPMLVDFDIDFTRVFIAADSAGASLATYVTAMGNSKMLQEAIGYKPGRLKFKALGLMSGIIYTDRKDPCGWIMSDQIYGEKRTDEEFLKYMNPENPEIINNLPPTYLITSRGDFVNHYSIMMNEALKKAGKPCHLLYYGDINLGHAFTTMQLDDSRSIEAVDKMLSWFEEQATIAAKEAANKRKAKKLSESQKEKMINGSMDDQKVWKYIKERAKADYGRISAPAVIDCTRTYTYGQMFNIWDKYARVFSALGMTEKNHSRVGIAGSVTAEPLFAFYALNMTGASVSMLSYPDFLPGGRWKVMVEKEKITDLVISDIMVTPQLWYEIQDFKKKTGLRNVILVHSLMGGPCVGPAELCYNEFNYHALRRIPGTKFLDDLVNKYGDTPISYGNDGGDHLALITHTSGSTKGTRKPLPYTDRLINAAASALPDGMGALIRDEDGKVTTGRLRFALAFDMSSYVNIVGVANGSFAAGYSVVLTFFGFMHPKFVKAIDYYKINVMLLTSFIVDSWMAMPDIDEVDFSSLKMLGVGGSYMSQEKLKKYMNFLRDRGYKYNIRRGYGMSEVGGAQLYVPEDCSDDILGYPYPASDFYILDEKDGKFYCADQTGHIGTMYVTSKSMSLNTLDGEELFPVTEIDGRKFICTNDMVRINDDGSVSYEGRMDKFFVNNDGVKFEQGIVETEIVKLDGVSQCTIVPILDKRIHDTVPVLYIKPEGSKSDIIASICAKLKKMYTEDEKLIGTALPSQIVIVDAMPCTATGKIDSYKLANERKNGNTYDIIATYGANKQLITVIAEKTEEVSSIKAGALPQGMGNDSALGLFEIFNGKSSDVIVLKQLKKMAREQREAMKDLYETAKPRLYIDKSVMTGKIMDTIPKNLVNKFMDTQGMLYRHDIINKDFED